MAGRTLWSADVQFVFGDYLLDPDRRELTRGSEAIAMGPQVFDLLLYLVHNRERVVSKDDLLDTVWAGRIVSESTLTSHINAVRKAIGEVVLLRVAADVAERQDGDRGPVGKRRSRGRQVVRQSRPARQRTG